MKKSKDVVCFLLTVLVLFFGGCGGGNVSLNGHVVFSDDGSPLTTGTVCFVTETMLARGTLDAGGKYTVGTNGQRDGLLPGTYRVYILGAQREIGTDENNMSIDEPLIDEKYMNPETSGLQVTVDRRTGQYDIRVERPDAQLLKVRKASRPSESTKTMPRLP